MRLTIGFIIVFSLNISVLSCKVREEIVPSCPERLSVDCRGLTKQECDENIRKIEEQICKDGEVKSRPYTEEVMLCLGASSRLVDKDLQHVTSKKEDYLECRSFLDEEGHPKNKGEWHQYLIRKMKDESEAQFTPEEISRLREGNLEDFRWGERYFRGTIKGYLQKYNIPYEDNEYSRKIESLSWPPSSREERLEKHTPPNLRKRLLEEMK